MASVDGGCSDDSKLKLLLLLAAAERDVRYLEEFADWLNSVTERELKSKDGSLLEVIATGLGVVFAGAASFSVALYTFLSKGGRENRRDAEETVREILLCVAEQLKVMAWNLEECLESEKGKSIGCLMSSAYKGLKPRRRARRDGGRGEAGGPAGI